MYFDETSNLTRIIAEDGSKFIFKWSTNSKAELTFTNADGTQQLNTEIDFDNISSKKRLSSYQSSPDISTQTRRRQATQISVAQEALLTEKKARVASQSVDVEVKKCGFPADAEVWVYMYKTDKLNQLVKIGEFPTYEVAKGLYSSSVVPDDAAEKIELNLQKICKSAFEQGVCMLGAKTVSKSLCLALTIISAPTGPGAIAVATACKLVDKALNLVVELGCKEIIDDLSVTQKAYEWCDAKFEYRDFRLWIGNLHFIARAYGIAEKPIDSKLIEIDGKENYPKLRIDLGDTPSVNSLILQPSKPSARQNYVALASLNCLPYNTRVSLSIVGTDGYQDSQSVMVTSLQSDGTFSVQLIVPGAETGIYDEVTLEAETPDGKTLHQTASLVFG